MESLQLKLQIRHRLPLAADIKRSSSFIPRRRERRHPSSLAADIVSNSEDWRDFVPDRRSSDFIPDRKNGGRYLLLHRRTDITSAMKSRGNSDGIGTEKQRGRKRFSGEVYLERDSAARKRDARRRWLRGRQGSVDVGGGHGGFSSSLQLRRWPPPLFSYCFFIFSFFYFFIILLLNGVITLMAINSCHHYQNGHQMRK